MEEAVVKKGYLYMYQQQTFGKKWRKCWGILYRGSSGASACLELQEGSLPPSPGKAKKRESSTGGRLIHLRDCVYVAETAKDAGCLKETTPFLLETTEKCYLLAAESAEAAGWILELCEHAFRRNSEMEKDRLQDKVPTSLAMAENPLYSSTCTGEKKHFPVTVRATPASERIRLWGKFLLSVQAEALELWDVLGGSMLHAWPYQFLRRFGHDKVIFSFEAGRRCSSGEGSFEFVTPEGKEIIQRIENAIDAQRDARTNDPGRGPSARASSSATLPTRATNQPSSEGGTRGITVTTLDKGPPASHTADTTMLHSLESNWRGKPERGSSVLPTGSSPLPTSAKKGRPRQLSDSCPKLDRQGGPRVLEWPGKMVVPEPESAEALDANPKPLVTSSASLPLHNNEQAPSPSLLDDRVWGRGLASTCLGPEHVYDDPEVLAHVVYDEPQELKGEAWKLQATAEDPVGHEYPYNPCLDDYSVPKMAAAFPPVQLPRQGRKGLVQAACEHRLLRFKTAKEAL